MEANPLPKTYRVSGTFRMGSDWSHFSSEVSTDTPAKAREKIFSDYGSRHHLERRLIKIEHVEEVKEKDEGHGR